MKLSKLFHTLYATVMALPVLIIPIFALNILHKETEPINIEVQEKMSIDFNQLARADEARQQDFTYRDLTFTYLENQSWDINGTTTAAYNVNIIYRINCINGHKYLVKSGSNNVCMTNGQNYTTNNGSYILTKIGTANLLFNIYCPINYTYSHNTFTPQVYDLTQMFGVGNEPTIEQFNTILPNDYYEYTTSQKMLVNKPTPTTFNNTDIGSQFIYALYKPVHDYFNFGDFFGLGGMYDWFTLNIFNGTAPLSFFIVFNVMIYWLFISLFWLLFDILIYVPMVIHKWLDKAEM